MVRGMPAEKAGLLPGDRIVSVEGAAVETFAEMRAAIKRRGAAALALFLLTLDGLFTCRVLLITHDIDALTPRILLETMKRRTA